MSADGTGEGTTRPPPTPNGRPQQCDEFPMAGTFQGASGNLEGFSVRPMDDTDNKKGGEAIQAFSVSTRAISSVRGGDTAMKWSKHVRAAIRLSISSTPCRRGTCSGTQARHAWGNP
ncbi:hypothetical protein GT354_16480 [Streptomyces sp. SID3343]|nr:hypothetical protein [Streptomyces sp. SID3343]